MADFHPEWIWADDEGSTVYAQVYGADLNIIFSFSANKDRLHRSLANRVCTSFERLEAEDPEATFPTIKDMHAAIWGSIRHIWPQCVSRSDLVEKLDAVVAIDSFDGSMDHVTWNVYSHSRFPQFLQHLADESLGCLSAGPGKSVDFASLVRYDQLGGRGCATRVRLPTGQYSVFKGVDFRTALQQSDDDDDKLIRNSVSIWRREITTLQQLPAHPNIMPPPTALVTVQWPDQSAPPVCCGALLKFYPGGDAASRIEDSNKQGSRLPLDLKARWCANMAAAVFHVHRVARTYHMDIKPGNFVADANDNLVLCDWEQNDGPATTLAPEADGTWDVTEEWQTPDDERPQLRYTKYSGALRRNVDEDLLGDAPWHTWNVFPIWTDAHPWALELAEVFSLGRSMWMLLRQPESDFEDIKHPDDLVTDWDKSGDILDSWKRIVDQCMSRDPNQRPDLCEIVKFWNDESVTQKAIARND